MRPPRNTCKESLAPSPPLRRPFLLFRKHAGGRGEITKLHPSSPWKRREIHPGWHFQKPGSHSEDRALDETGFPINHSTPGHRPARGAASCPKLSRVCHLEDSHGQAGTKLTSAPIIRAEAWFLHWQTCTEALLWTTGYSTGHSESPQFSGEFTF